MKDTKKIDLSTEKVKTRKYVVLPSQRVKKKIPASDWFPTSDGTPNILILGKKGSGKTMTVFNIIKAYVDDLGANNVVCQLYAPTINRAEAWQKIKGYLDFKKVGYIAKPTFSGKDKSIGKFNIIRDFNNMIEDYFPEQTTIFVFDDLTMQMRDEAVAELFSTNRHGNCVVICSTHVTTNLTPGAREQSNFYILMNGLARNMVEKVFESAQLSVPVEQAWDFYRRVADERYSFLWIKADDPIEYRRNFDTRVNVRVEEEDEKKEGENDEDDENPLY